MKKLPIAMMMVAAFTLTACSSNVSPDVYSVEGTGQVAQTVAGTVISARPVQIEGTNKIGTVAGAVAGGVAGSAIGGNGRVHALGAIGGAIIGGLVGNAAEKWITKEDGMEYIVQTDSGDSRTIVQGATPAFAVGQRVYILYGQKARIIANNNPAEPTAAPADTKQQKKPNFKDGNWETTQKITI